MKNKKELEMLKKINKLYRFFDTTTSCYEAFNLFCCFKKSTRKYTFIIKNKNTSKKILNFLENYEEFFTLTKRTFTNSVHLKIEIHEKPTKFYLNN